MVMRTMRNNIDVLKWMFVLLLVVFGLGLVLPTGSRDLAGAAAIVDGKPVDGQHYSRMVQARLENERQGVGGELSDGESLRIRKAVLDDLIDEELALAHADALGQKSSVEEFRQAVLNDPSFKDEKGNYDPKRYEQLLDMQAQQGLDWKQAEASFQRGMLLQKVRGFFADQAVLSPGEQAAALAKLDRQVRAQAAVWDLAKLKASQKLTDDEIHTYYSENKQKWAKPDQVKLRQILVKTDFAMATATAKAKADGILAKLKSGADFKALAATENSDASAKANGGDLGWMSR
jgi:peptidyl-prolyl cis-trans isomerase D